MSTSTETQPPVYLECFGARSHLPEVAVRAAGGREYHFVHDDALRQSCPASAGVFFDEATAARSRFRYPRRRRVAVLKESPLTAPGDAALLRRDYAQVFTFRESLLAQGAPFVELVYGTNWLGAEGALDGCEKTRLISFVGSLLHDDSHGYRIRRDVAEWLLSRTDVDCYGKGIRPVAAKLEALAPYCFSVCMENTRENWYVTEKLIDCLLTQTVPIYWGCPDVSRYFDPRGILSFETLEDLAKLLPVLTRDRYDAMRPYVIANAQRAIAKDMHSHSGYYRRLATHLDGWLRSTPVRPWSRSRAMAAGRCFFSALSGRSRRPGAA